MRRRRGRGFEYLDPAGDRIDDPEVQERVAELGHLQVTGLDAAGR